jgi:hypothetical protein
MAKKTSKKAATKKAAKKKAPAKKQKPVEEKIVLDAVEETALELAHSSDEACKDLELAATLAISQAVRKVFKKHGVTLNAVQGEKVALILFGD